MLFRILRELRDDAYLKSWARSKGYNSYPSSTGMRDVKTNNHCYTNPTTGKKTMWK